MKLVDLRTAYETLSGKASDIVRQLSLGGIALIWLFKNERTSAPILEVELLRAAVFISLALVCDLLQYLIGTTALFIYFRHKEKTGVKEEDDFLAPEQLNWPTWFLFAAKSLMVLAAYIVFLLPFLMRRFVG